MKISVLPIFFCLLLTVTACKKQTTNTVTYDVTNANVTSFAFTANDTMPGLAAAKFTVENLSDTGRIFLTNGDSIAYGTNLKRVIPVIRYGGRPSAAICYTGDTSIVLSGKDTLDFTLTPIRLQIYAADKKHEKWYNIIAPVHQADPDLYIWEQLTQNIVPAKTAEQKCLLASGKFCFFRSTAETNRVALSDNGTDWTDNNITTLPTPCHCRQIQYDSIGKRFYYLNTTDNTIYSSDDALTWQATSLDSDAEPLAFWACFDGKLWALLQSGTNKDSCYLATVNLTTGTYDNQYRLLRSQAPVSDFASVIYQADNGYEHALIAGGYNAEGKMIADSWAMEAVDGIYRIVNLQNSHTAKPFAGASIVRYNGQLMMYGGVNSSYELNDDVLISANEGMTWNSTNDTIHCLLPTDYTPRWRQSAITDGYYIYLIGGQSKEQFFTDIYRGKLNSIDW